MKLSKKTIEQGRARLSRSRQGVRVPNDVREKIAEEFAANIKAREIADKYGVSIPTVGRIAREMFGVGETDNNGVHRN